jgi:hypothetical protein
MRGRKGINRVPVGKPERKRRLGRHRSRWEDNIKMYLQKIGSDGVQCIDPAHYKQKGRVLVKTAIIKFVKFLDQL